MFGQSYKQAEKWEVDYLGRTATTWDQKQAWVATETDTSQNDTKYRKLEAKDMELSNEV